MTALVDVNKKHDHKELLKCSTKPLLDRSAALAKRLEGTEAGAMLAALTIRLANYMSDSLDVAVKAGKR